MGAELILLTPEQEWKAKCQQQRTIARFAPCYTPVACLDPCYRWSREGRWHLSLTLETWCAPPVWHATAALLEDLKHSDNEWGMPEQGLLATQVWDTEQQEQARHLLADAMGEILRPNDESQQAEEIKGLFCLHWRIFVDMPILQFLNGRGFCESSRND